jgi:hypothetical protein
LRTLIAGQVEDLTTLPRHVLDNITARRDSDRRKNPGMDPWDRTDLLSYCDLRELQDILTGRELWPLWASTFGTKEQLHHRFGQLASLRNAVRHSRQVDDVTRRDGEAALLWFARAIESARN